MDWRNHAGRQELPAYLQKTFAIRDREGDMSYSAGRSYTPLIQIKDIKELHLFGVLVDFVGSTTDYFLDLKKRLAEVTAIDLLSMGDPSQIQETVRDTCHRVLPADLSHGPSWATSRGGSADFEVIAMDPNALERSEMKK